MRPELAPYGAILLSSCIIAGGIVVGAQTFAIDVPFAPYIMVMLAALVVLGAAMLVISSKGAGAADPSRR